MSPGMTLYTFTLDFLLARRLFQGTGTERNDIPLLFDTQIQCTRTVYMINERMADGLGVMKRDVYQAVCMRNESKVSDG